MFLQKDITILDKVSFLKNRCFKVWQYVYVSKYVIILLRLWIIPVIIIVCTYALSITWLKDIILTANNLESEIL